MPWSRRGNQRYYFEKVRINGRPTRRYLGNGEAAHAAAAGVEQRRQQREAERRQRQEDQRRHAEATATLDEMAELTQLLMTATLLASGYHLHSRTWRRRRR